MYGVMSTGNSEEQLLLLLFLYFNRDYFGRSGLARALQVGEGRLRRLLAELADVGFIVKVRAGTRLTARGVSEVERYLLQKGVVGVFLSSAEELGSEVAVVAYTLVGYSPSIRIVELRDEAVRGGARGAVLLRYEDGKLIVPPIEEDFCVYAKTLCRNIMRRKEPKQGSLVITVFGDSLKDAVQGLVRLLESRYYLALIHPSKTPGSSAKV
ncbi:MAG: DUF4443 domain-containing protein [Infirmifilum sp.]